jgi:hypothetical protein
MSKYLAVALAILSLFLAGSAEAKTGRCGTDAIAAEAVVIKNTTCNVARDVINDAVSGRAHLRLYKTIHEGTRTFRCAYRVNRRLDYYSMRCAAGTRAVKAVVSFARGGSVQRECLIKLDRNGYLFYSCENVEYDAPDGVTVQSIRIGGASPRNSREWEAQVVPPDPSSPNGCPPGYLPYSAEEPKCVPDV